MGLEKLAEEGHLTADDLNTVAAKSDKGRLGVVVLGRHCVTPVLTEWLRTLAKTEKDPRIAQLLTQVLRLHKA